jgi:hypothetical protein
MPRRITQLTAMSETIAALCDDGSVWLLAIPLETSS